VPGEFRPGNPGLFRGRSERQALAGVEIEGTVDLDLPQAPAQKLEQHILL
jgi:hypothetical protein